MKTHTLKITGLIVLTALLLSSCSALPLLPAKAANNSAVAEKTLNQAASTPAAVQTGGDFSSALVAYEATLENVYTQVNPSVVNIRVVEQQMASSLDLGQLPFGFNLPQNSAPLTPQYNQTLGSGFVWDGQGHIVTNNHVVDGADKIEVTFSDGSIFPATLVGADSDSDLAVIQVEGAGELLHPIQLADSTQVKVGEIAITIGNPFGLEGTMTVGIVSALGRTITANNKTTSFGAVYSIPDIIQTDAPINPGNSGGVLVDDLGKVIGVTAAIESSVNSNAGIGFAIPSAIVKQVVPALIKTGKYEHPYLGISVSTLTPDKAKAMNLKVGQRGALVVEVVENGPAAQAGLLPSQDSVTIDGRQYPIGGDVITAVNGQSITKPDDLIAYLNDETEVGQAVKLTLLRKGQETSLEVTLAVRPVSSLEAETTQNGSEGGTPKAANNAWLGILGADLTSEVANAMNLNSGQQGVLIIQVESGSPAEKAGLQGSNQETTIHGETIKFGGDVITSFDGKPITSLLDLKSAISASQAGIQAILTILRDGKTIEVPVTLSERPVNLP